MCRRQILAVHNYSLCMRSFCIRTSLYLPLFWRESNNRCYIIFRYMAMGYWRLSRGRKWKNVHAQGHFGLLWFPYAVALGWKKHEVFPLGHPHMPLHKGLKIRYLLPHTAQIAWRLSSHATDGKNILPPVWDSLSCKSDGTITSTSSTAYYSLQPLAERKEIRAASHFLLHI